MASPKKLQNSTQHSSMLRIQTKSKRKENERLKNNQEEKGNLKRKKKFKGVEKIKKKDKTIT